MSEQVIKQRIVYCWAIMSFLSSQSRTTATSFAVTSVTVKGFSIYENITHNVSMQYPSGWNKQEILNNDFTAVVMFLVPTQPSFSSREDSEKILQKIKDMIYNESSTTVDVSIKRSLPVHDTETLQDITNDQIHLLDICFDNVNLLETSYDRKMGEIQASKLIYTYTDPLENHRDKKGMKIISVHGYKELVITYSSQNQDFDKFISIVDRMVGTFRIVEQP
jgi:eukaryotic-like serine/threonine-protein kinase